MNIEPKELQNYEKAYEFRKNYHNHVLKERGKLFSKTTTRGLKNQIERQALGWNAQGNRRVRRDEGAVRGQYCIYNVLTKTGRCRTSKYTSWRLDYYSVIDPADRRNHTLLNIVHFNQ